MADEVERSAVMEALEAHAPRAVHVGELARELDVAPDDRASLEQLLGRLAELELVNEMPGGKYRLARGWKDRLAQIERAERRPTGSRRPAEAPTGAAIRGRLSMTPRAFGFVTTEDGGDDVFIPPPSVGIAMHGDLVLVTARRSAKGREGEIVRVLERGLTRFAGILHRSGQDAWLEPDDGRVRGPMRVVGDIPPDAREGLVVEVEIVHYPTRADEAPEVRVRRALGRAGVAAVEVAGIKIREGIIEEFPPDVLEEAKQLPLQLTDADRRGREDLRGIPLVTIDPEDARDHDDAVWAERLPDGGFRVLVCIADVSHYVRPGTAIDREALRRGCSVYLPDRAIPMLPPELSSNLASLLPNEDRLTLAVEAELGPTGQLRKHRFVRGVMRSRAKVHYAGAARALGLTTSVPVQPEAEAQIESLRAVHEASKLLRVRRSKRGSLDFDLPEPRVKLDANQEPVDVVRSRQDPGVRQAYQMIEEMMLLANEVVATDLGRRGIPLIYRVHGAPDADKVAKFAELAVSLGYALDADAGENPRKLQKFLRKIEGTPHAQALGYLLLRAMQQAVYDTHNIGHFGLAARDYLHFTSPIRRYPDLAVHRVLHAFALGQEIDAETLRTELQWQAMESSRLERRAMTAERDAVNLYRAILMRDRVGDVFDCVITGLAGHGVYVSFDAPFVEGLIPLQVLGDDLYELDDLGIRLVGQNTGRTFSLGDRLRVEIVDVSIARREISVVPEGTVLEPGALERAPAARLGTRPQGRGAADGGKGGRLERKQPGDRRRRGDGPRLGKHTSSASGRGGGGGGGGRGKSAGGGKGKGKGKGGRHK